MWPAGVRSVTASGLVLAQDAVDVTGPPATAWLYANGRQRAESGEFKLAGARSALDKDRHACGSRVNQDKE